MLTRAKKEEHVAELKDKFSRAKSIYVADFRGLSVESANELRRRIRKEGAGEFEYRVAKNSVLRLASADLPAEAIQEHFEGPTAVAFSYSEPVGLAKILSEFSKDHEVFEIKGGMVDGEVVDAIQIAALAKLPSLDQLRSILIGLVQAPATKIARLVSEPAAQLARLLDAHATQGGAAEGGSE